MNDTQLRPFIHKTVPFAFQQRKLRFHLSQSLFSSNSIDDGSRLLLKYVAQTLDLKQVQTALDVGSGVGVLGLSLKKMRPAIQLAVQERDALALAFTQANAQLNNIDGLEIIPGLGLQNVNGRSFDLILSNLPGKAGVAVLQTLVQKMSNYLSQNGHAAVVVVKPLEGAILEALADNGSPIHLQTSSAMHTILIFGRGAPVATGSDGLALYLRERNPFTVDNTHYQLDVAYNLPDFDTLGFMTRLTFKLFNKLPLRGNVFMWNPGQGHIPVVAARRAGRKISHFTLGSRDALSLQTSARNLQNQGVATDSITLTHTPTIAEINGRFDTIILHPDSDPGLNWSDQLPRRCADMLAPDGHLLLVAKSGFISSFLSANKALRPLQQKKYHGFRAVLLRLHDSGK